MTDVKRPGYKSAGFWAVAATNLLAVLMAAGVDPAGADPSSAAKGVGVIVALLATLGYTVARNRFKKGDPKKKFWKRSEFYLTIAAVLVSGVMASGALDVDGKAYEGVAYVATLLAALGYRYNWGGDPKPTEA